jgi:hypothetical protein
MNTSPNELARPAAIDVDVSLDTLTVRLADGRSIAVPVDWYPRLADGTPQERTHWELIADGRGIRWPELDEDISVDALLSGKRSNEASSSLKKWRSTRTCKA